jgi:large subunit ribosomal protein L23
VRYERFTSGDQADSGDREGYASCGAAEVLFTVAPDSNKIEIKRAVEQLFDVKVEKVNTMNYEGKKKRQRTMKYGKRPDWKRAVVTLAEDHKIDLA